MRVLVACEFSGTVRDAFIKNGHYAVSCDLLESESTLGEHYQGNVLDIIDDNWDLLIGHPPCTYLANSGVSWLHKDASRWDRLREGADFFKSLLNSNIPKICIENPIMHKYGRELIGEKYTQIVHPYMFGHPEQKSTCLWLKNLPPLIPTNNLKEYMLTLPKHERERIHYAYFSAKDKSEVWKIRSKTFQGIADAMASQWGAL